MRSRGMRVGVDQGYELWAPGYDAQECMPLPRLERDAMLSLLPEVRGTWADLGCGTGRYARLLTERGARTVIALDRSAAMLARLTRKGIAARAILADISSLPLRDARLDGAVCALAYGHVPDLPAAIREAARVLRPGAPFLVSDFHADAALAGLSRAFDAGGRTYILPHHPRSLSDYERALGEAGMTLAASTSRCAADEPSAFAGRRRLKKHERDLPVVLALLARRS